MMTGFRNNLHAPGHQFNNLFINLINLSSETFHIVKKFFFLSIL